MLMQALYVLLAFASTTALIVLIHYLFTVCAVPYSQLRFRERVRNTIWEKMYVACILIAVGVTGYGGAKVLLFWVPESWGGSDEDGNFTTAREAVSLLIGALALGLVAYLESAAARTLALEGTSNNALFPQLRRQRRAPILRYHLYTAVVRAVLPCTHETMTIFRGALESISI
ncbi:MAG: hypothetical protein GKR94_27630 [Gammaproteobacteria bacterium]|nr:hypothetical protein [Gammaproteobacteria bacterium]